MGIASSFGFATATSTSIPCSFRQRVTCSRSTPRSEELPEPGFAISLAQIFLLFLDIISPFVQLFNNINYFQHTPEDWQLCEDEGSSRSDRATMTCIKLDRL